MSDVNITWDQETEENFNKIIEKMPSFVREMGRNKVAEKVGSILKEEERDVAGEKDLVDALFEVTPFGFHGPMKTDLTELGIDYTKYGHPE